MHCVQHNCLSVSSQSVSSQSSVQELLNCVAHVVGGFHVHCPHRCVSKGIKGQHLGLVCCQGQSGQGVEIICSVFLVLLLVLVPPQLE